MFDYLHLYTYAEMKHDEFIKQAEAAHMIKKSRPTPKRVNLQRLFCSLLNRTGQVLVHWGSSLQRRYSS